MNVRSDQLFELCQSERFLNGSSDQLAESKFEFEGRKSWEIRVVGADEYLEAIRSNDLEAERETSWHLLHEKHLPSIGLIASRALSIGTGSVISELKKQRSELGRILCTSPKIKQIADKLAVDFGIDSDRLVAENLGEMAFSQLGVMFVVNELMPTIEFPLFTVLWNAYKAGLMPFGVYGWQLDDSYAGPDVLLCIVPRVLSKNSDEPLETDQRGKGGVFARCHMLHQ